MDLLAYFKAEPTEYILAYSNGKIFRQGAGQTFWYWGPGTSIVLVPVSTVDALFVFNETTGNFQAMTVQGQMTYRITAPQTVVD
ncbi:MAG TPA: SPFH domain-containing protein, partial [Ktedonosporobacter sp.]|nr:SPFH domain-containing protein [Ktedonosporobacter sp.]